MCQVNARARFGQHVGRPVPAVRRLQDNLGRLAPHCDLLRQVKRIVVDANRWAEPLTVRGHPHDHTAPPMQVYTDDLPAGILIHKGPPSSWYVVTTPENR